MSDVWSNKMIVCDFTWPQGSDQSETIVGDW